MPVTVLNGVGDKKGEALAQVGVEPVADLLTYYPRRYVDRTKEARIRDLDGRARRRWSSPPWSGSWPGGRGAARRGRWSTST